MADPYAAFELVQNDDPYARFEFVGDGAELVPTAPTGAGDSYQPGGMKIKSQQQPQRENNITGTGVERDIRQGITGPLTDWLWNDNKGGGLYDRATDTAAFIGSLPVRIVTQGQKGLGDVMPYLPLGDYLAKDVSKAEKGFMDRNQNLLLAAKNFGDATIFMAPMMQPLAPARPAVSPQVGTPTGRTMSQTRAAEGAADLAAFERQGVRPFGPAFNEGPTASVGKQLTETPVVGAPLRNSLHESFADTATAVNRVADRVAPNATYETAGTAVQRGMDRYRSQGFDSLEPNVVRGLGIDPNSPVQRPQRGGAAQMTRINQGQDILQQVTGGTVQNTRGANVPLPQTRAQKMTTRTRLEDLSDAELGRVIRAPSDQTSFSARLEALYERAYRGLPPMMRSNGSVDPMLLPTANSATVVRDLVQNEARTGIRAGLQGRYGQMFETLSNYRANVPLATLREMRTAIGRELSNFGMYEASLDRTQLRRLYAALSSDIEVGLQDIAVRAARATQGQGNRGVSVPQARRAAQMLRDIQVADRYARLGFERMDRFLSIVRQQNPQQAASALVRYATEGGTGNMRLYRSAMNVLRAEERAEFASLVMRQMGAPTASARGVMQETGFSPSRFVTAYEKMAPEARNQIFTPEHRQVIDDLFRVSNRLANVEALANTSRSATNATNLGMLGAAGAAVTAGSDALLTFGGTAAGMGAASVLMSRPQYARWMVQYMQLRADVRSGTQRAVSPLVSHIKRLGRMARDNPALVPVVAVVAGHAGIDEEGR